MTETVLEESSGAVTAPKKVRLKKPLKITIIIFLEIVLAAGFAVGGFFVCKKFFPTIIEYIPSEYMTYSELKLFYKPEIEKETVAEYGDDYFELYKRCYTKLLDVRRLNVVTKGLTNSAGISVDVNNLKKLEDNKFYMFISSTGEGGALSSMANNSVKAYFDINYEQADLTMVKVDNLLNTKDDSNRKEITEKRYIAKWGVLPYAFGSYLIVGGDNGTIRDSKMTEEDGLHKLTFTLDPVLSTANLVKQMTTLASGKDPSYSGGSVEYSVFFDDEFVIRKVVIDEEYKVMGLYSSSTVTDTYIYEGEEGYSALTSEERYENIKA